MVIPLKRKGYVFLGHMYVRLQKSCTNLLMIKYSIQIECFLRSVSCIVMYNLIKLCVIERQCIGLEARKSLYFMFLIYCFKHMYVLLNRLILTEIQPTKIEREIQQDLLPIFQYVQNVKDPSQ